jgi:hypothetical protein
VSPLSPAEEGVGPGPSDSLEKLFHLHARHENEMRIFTNHDVYPISSHHSNKHGTASIIDFSERAFVLFFHRTFSHCRLLIPGFSLASDIPFVPRPVRLFLIQHISGRLLHQRKTGLQQPRGYEVRHTRMVFWNFHVNVVCLFLYGWILPWIVVISWLSMACRLDLHEIYEFMKRSTAAVGVWH